MIRLRRFWFQVHKWIGLILMIVLIPLCLSGSALVWHDALDGWLNPQRSAVSGQATLPPSAYAEAARKAAGDGALVANIRWPEGGKGAVVVSLAKPSAAGAPVRPGPPQRTNVWLDPPTARVLDVAGSNDGFVRLMHNFHGNLTIPGVGRAIVGWLGVFLFVSALSGLWLWWPMVGSFAKGLRWRRARAFDTNLHHQVGFWITLPLAMLAFTGVWIAAPQMLGGGPGGQGGAQAARGDAGRTQGAQGEGGRGGEHGPSEGHRRRAQGGAAPAARAAAGGGDVFARFRAKPLAETAMTPDAALAAAAAAHPTMLTWPTDRDGAWRIALGRGREAGIDDATGAELPPAPPREQGGIMRTMRRLHDGDDMGAIWQVLIFLGGIAPLVLGVTGILMWLRTRKWRAKAARRGSPSPAPAE